MRFASGNRLLYPFFFQMHLSLYAGPMYRITYVPSVFVKPKHGQFYVYAEMLLVWFVFGHWDLH